MLELPVSLFEDVEKLELTLLLYCSNEESLAGVDVSSKELAGGAKDSKIKPIAPLAL
jgi:hypothetical protein